MVTELTTRQKELIFSALDYQSSLKAVFEDKPLALETMKLQQLIYNADAVVLFRSK